MEKTYLQDSSFHSLLAFKERTQVPYSDWSQTTELSSSHLKQEDW